VDQVLDERDKIRDYLLLLDGTVGYDVSDMTLAVALRVGQLLTGEPAGCSETQEDWKMESKKPPTRRVKTGAAARTRRDSGAQGPVILDFVQCRIEAFNREQGGGVVVSKDDKGYLLTGEETGIPIARLRPKGRRGEFQVLYWNRETDRWRLVSLFGGSVFSLDEALDFISNDPMDCFWN
jgi:hypothetical protein